MTITWRIEFDWDGDGSFAYDESTRVTALRIERGRRNDFEAFAAGKAVLTLDNHDRRFDPWFAASPLNGLVLPRRGVRVSVVDDTVLSGVELVVNGGFETVTGTDDDNLGDVFAGWTWSHASIEEMDPADPNFRTESSSTRYAGARALKIWGDSGNPKLLQLIALTPGAYQFSFWARASFDGYPGFVIYDNSTFTALAYETSLDNSDTWTRYTANFVAPAECSAVYIFLSIENGAGDVYFDEVSLQKFGGEKRLFTGRIEDIEPSGGIGNRKVLITAYDGLRDLAEVDVPAELQKAIRTDEGITAVLDASGWPAAERSLDAGNDTLGYWWTPGGEKAKQTCDDLARSEFGAFYMTAEGKAKFVNRRNYNTAEAVGTLDQADVADVLIKRPWETVYNVVTVRCNPLKMLPAAALWTLEDTGVYVEPGGSVELWAEYQDGRGNACAAENVISPVATTDYAGNAVAGGGGTDMTADMAVAANIYSAWAKLTVTNTHATASLYITLLRIRGDAITQSPTPVRREDAASQAIYGKRALTFDVPWQQSINTATDLADTLVNFYADPRPAVDVMLDNVLPDLWNYELCDRTMVTIAEYDIDQVMRINSLTLWTGKTMQDVKATFGLGPADDATYWLLGEAGVGELGETTRLGY